MRRKANYMKIGSVAIGADNPIAVQSMLSCRSDALAANLLQAKGLWDAGCEILRVAIPNMASVGLIAALKETVEMPIVADIHFDWKLALASVDAGADKIRINPGNIGSDDRVKVVANACAEKNIPIRIGVNSGSVEKEILAKHGSATPAALAESALYHANLLERFDFHNIALSVKSSNVATMMQAYHILAETTTYPLHLGVTHTGTVRMGLLKSAAGIGGLLAQGVGDTIRVSLAAPPVEEVLLGKEILKAVGYGDGVEIIACPTCGRATVDIIKLTKQVEAALSGCNMPLTVAVMGCVVNGPGEAREADLGITGGGNGLCALFRKGEVITTAPQEQIIDKLLEQIDVIRQERGE